MLITGKNNPNVDPLNPLVGEGEFITDNSQIALEWCAVLASQNINFELKKQDDTWVFLVDSANFPSADFNISEYEGERHSFYKKLQELNPPLKNIPKFKLIYSLPYIFCSVILLISYNLSNTFETYRDAGILKPFNVIKNHQWERVVTALTLHADYPHLLGNSLFFVIFATIAGHRVGGGFAVFAIILTGIFGNITTLLLNSINGYNSLGASTAVFGALGVISIFSFISRKQKESSFFQNMVPLTAGVALLVFTGAAPGSDVTAHLFGFIWGVIIGAIIFFYKNLKTNNIAQSIFYILSIIIIVSAWFIALA